MYKMCKTEQSARRQREIESTLLEMMLKRSYGEITITELCDKLHMPRKAFYRYFDSKDDALYALIEHTMADYSKFELYSDLGKLPRTLKGEIVKYYAFWFNNKTLLDALYKNGLIDRIIDVSLSFPVNDMVNIKKFLPEDSDWARERVYKFAVCGLVFQMIEWYKDGFKTSLSDIAQISCRMLSKPLFPNLESLGIALE